VFRALSNLLFRGQDPTRDWQSDPSKLVVDVEHGTLCGVAVGGSFPNQQCQCTSPTSATSSQGTMVVKNVSVYTN